MSAPFRLLALLPLIGLAACETESLGPTSGPSGPVTHNAPIYQPGGGGEDFREGDFAWSRAAGAGGIIGVLTFRDGSTRYSCRGRDVILIPETPWVRRRMYILYGSTDGAVVPADIVRARTPQTSSGDYASYARKTTCDGVNRFNFQGLADGAWYVITLARPDDGSAGAMAVMRRVEIHGVPRQVNLD
jgi:hypothetical protein